MGHAGMLAGWLASLSLSLSSPSFPCVCLSPPLSLFFFSAPSLLEWLAGRSWLAGWFVGLLVC